MNYINGAKLHAKIIMELKGKKKCSTTYFNEPEDNMQNQTISELYTDDKKQNILAIPMILINQVKIFMKILIPRDNL